MSSSINFDELHLRYPPKHLNKTFSCGINTKNTNQNYSLYTPSYLKATWNWKEITKYPKLQRGMFVSSQAASAELAKHDDDDDNDNDDYDILNEGFH